MEIGIIGGGSIGLLFAAYLMGAGQVTIYTRTSEQAEEINRSGLVLEKGPEQTKLPALAKPIDEWAGGDDLTIIAVKQYQLGEVIDRICSNGLCSKSLLFLQNGMGHLEKIAEISAGDILVGAVEHGALKINNHTVRHNGDGVTNIAAYKGSLKAVKKVAELISETFPFSFKEDFYQMMINKLIINAVINPFTAVLGVKNGALLDNPFYFQTARQLFSEIAAVLDLDNSERHFEQIQAICRKTAENRSSMLKDIEAGRRTEVDAILGYILKTAVQKERKCPILECFYHLIKGMEYDRGEIRC